MDNDSSVSLELNCENGIHNEHNQLVTEAI